jgi:hypothetical protein
MEELRLQLPHLVVVVLAASTRHPHNQHQVDSEAVAMEAPRIPLLQARAWIRDREVAVSVSVLVESPSRLVEEDDSSKLDVLAAEAPLDKPKLSRTFNTGYQLVHCKRNQILG